MFLVPINFPSVLTPGTVVVSDDYEPGSRRGTWGVDEVRLNRTYMNRLKAVTSSATIGPAQVIAATGAVIGMVYQFPYAGLSPTEKDTGSYLQSITAENTSEDGKQWSIVLEYAPFDVWSLLGNSDIQQGLINPLDRAYEVWWDSAKYQRSKPYDESGEQENGDPGLPYLNTVGDPLLDIPPTEETRPVLNIARNESTYNDAWASQFKDTVNSDEFLGFPPNTAKCKDIKGDQRIWDPDWGWYFRVTYQFEFRDDDDGEGFTQLILNAGYRQKVNGSGNPVNVVDANGNTVTDAVPLQKNGAYTPGATPYFLEFQEFPTSTFGDLNLPDDLLYIASGNS